MVANNRNSETMDAIALLTSTTVSDMDTYSYLSRTVTLLMLELVIVNKNLLKALKENTRLERVLGQYHQRNGRAGGGRENKRGGPSTTKRGALLMAVRV